MSIQLSDYRNQTFEVLVEQAYEKGFDNAGQFAPAELIFELVCAAADTPDGSRVNIVVDGLLEILSDGFGFLRSPVSDFAAGADDVYVSPAQIRRFNLQTGDWIQGQARIPRDNERYFALLRIEKVNDRSPEIEKKRLAFDSQSISETSQISSDSPLANIAMGSSILLEKSARQNALPTVISLLQAFDSAVLTLLNVSLEDAGVLKRAWPKGMTDGRILVSTRGSDANRHLQVLDLGLQRCKRLVEQFQDVHWVVLDANQIALATQASVEQQGKNGSDSLGVEAVCKALSEARNLETTGSLTIWMGAHQGRSTYEDCVLERVSYEATKRCTISADGALKLI
jgi:transcription termination factor Rho